VGDVHGCAAELEELLRVAGYDRNRHRCIQVGDLYTRGPDPMGVWNLVRRHEIECVVGNHERHLLKLLPSDAGKKGRDRAPLRNGFLADPHFGGRLEEVLTELRALPLWIRSTPGAPAHPWVVVHAGVDPFTGFSPQCKPKTLTTIRLWPPAGNPSRHWHDFYRGEELVIFGHDAIGGLVERRDRDGRARAIGLDSGCVYGGRLTGYWIERDCLVSVPARHAWWPVR